MVVTIRMIEGRPAPGYAALVQRGERHFSGAAVVTVIVTHEG